MPRTVIKMVFWFLLFIFVQTPSLCIKAKAEVLLAKKTPKKKSPKKKPVRKGKPKKKPARKGKPKKQTRELESIEFLRRKIPILGDKINNLKKSLKTAKHKKKIRLEIRKAGKELRLAKQNFEKHKKDLLTNYEQKKEVLIKANNEKIAQYNGLKNKADKTPKDFNRLLSLAKDIATADVEINHISNVLRQLKLNEFYTQIFILKPKLKSLFDTVVRHEMQLLQTSDYYQQYDLESKVHQAYAEAITIENQLMDLENQIAPLSHIYLNNVELYLSYYKSIQTADKKSYADLMNKLKTLKFPHRNLHQLRASQDRLDHITWWVEQDLAFLNNPSHIRVKQRPIEEKISSQTPDKTDPLKLNISIAQVIDLYNNHYNQRKLSELKDALTKDQNRLKNLFDNGQLSRGQLQDIRRHEDDLRTLLEEINKQLASFNIRSRDTYHRDNYPRDHYSRDTYGEMRWRR